MAHVALSTPLAARLSPRLRQPAGLNRLASLRCHASATATLAGGEAGEGPSTSGSGDGQRTDDTCTQRADGNSLSGGREGPRRARVCLMVEPSPFTHISGMKNRFLNLISCLRNSGDEVLVVTPGTSFLPLDDAGTVQPASYSGAQVESVRGFRLPFYAASTLMLSLGLSYRVFLMLRDWQPDVIHASSPGLLVFAAIIFAKLLRRPLVVSYHTHIPAYIPRYTFAWLVDPMWRVISFCHRMADLTLVTSEPMRTELAGNAYAPCKPNGPRIDVWRKGVDTEIFHPRFRSPAGRAALGAANDSDSLLVYVGRLGAEKNLEALVPLLAAQAPSVRLALVGGGPEESPLKSAFESAGLADRVTFAGMLSGEALSAAYASADVFVMPSESETLGFVVLEAMASGVPVVAVAAGGLPDIVADGVTGYLYPRGDGAAAASRVRQLLGDGPLRARMQAAARSEVEKWGWQAATDHLRRQYARAMRRRALWNRLQGLLVRVALLARLRSLGLWGVSLLAGVGGELRRLHPLAAEMKVALLLVCSAVLGLDFVAALGGRGLAIY